MSAERRRARRKPARRERRVRGRDAALRERPARVFAALGDETRLNLVSRLGAGDPLSISSLTAGTGITRQAVSRHLRVLDRAGLVRARRVGRETLWRLEPDQLDEARRILDRIAAQWDVGLAKLKAFVER